MVREAQRGTIRERIGAAGAFLLVLSWFLQVRRRRKLRRRYAAEVLLDPGLDLVGREVARHHERRVVGRVERLEERADIVDRGRIEVGEIAVEVVRVVPVFVGRHRQIDPREPAVWLVQHVDLDLVLDDLLLVLEVLDVDVERAHAIGFRPQHRLEHVRGNDLEIVREVEPRRSVQEPAVGLDEADERHLAEVGRALEHHVFEQVRKPGAILGFIAKADVVIHGHARGRRRHIAREDHFQPVGELVILDGHPQFGSRRCRGARRLRCQSDGWRKTGRAGHQNSRHGAHGECESHTSSPLEAL